MEIDGEKFFEPVLVSFGFSRVDSDIGSAPKFKNADFINKKSRVIVEVKTIKKEFMPTGGFIPKINSIMINPVNKGNIGAGQYTFEIDPFKKMENVLYEPVRRTLRSARDQIEETRDYYFKNNREPDPIGIVLLVLQGLENVPPSVVAEIVKHCMDNGVHEIDAVCVCAPFFKTRNPINGMQNNQAELVYRTIDEDKAEMCKGFYEIINAAIKIHNGEHQSIINVKSV